MGFFVLLLLIIGVIVIISSSSGSHSSGGYHGGFARDYDDDYEDYEIRAARGDREMKFLLLAVAVTCGVLNNNSYVVLVFV